MAFTIVLLVLLPLLFFPQRVTHTIHLPKHNTHFLFVVDYTKKPENNQAPDRSNFLFLEQMYGNAQGTSQHYSNVNGTQGLHCASTSAEASEIFKKRMLHDSDLSQYAKFLSLSSESSTDIGHLEDGPTRHLLRNDHKEVYERSIGNGMKILSVYHKKML